MGPTEIIMLIVCVPILIMLGVLTYILLAIVLKEEFGRNIWPFNKKEDEDGSLHND